MCIIYDLVQVARFDTTEKIRPTVLDKNINSSHRMHPLTDVASKMSGVNSLVAHGDSPNFFRSRQPSHSSARERSDLWVRAVVCRGVRRKLNLAEQLDIVPNSAILVINLHDQIYGVRNGMIEKVIPVTGRGRGS